MGLVLHLHQLSRNTHKMNKYPTTHSHVGYFNPKIRFFPGIDFLAKPEKEHSHNELNL